MSHPLYPFVGRFVQRIAEVTGNLSGWRILANCAWQEGFDLLSQHEHIESTGVHYTIGYCVRPSTTYCSNRIISNFSSSKGYNENYSAYYERRSRDKDQCLYNENDQWEDQSIPSGQTLFTKVRIDLHSLQVITDDYTFSRTSGRRPQPFATAGDCFSSTQQCPRGVFSINFENTKFRIRPRTRWETRGMNATQQFAGHGVSPIKWRSVKRSIL